MTNSKSWRLERLLFVEEYSLKLFLLLICCHSTKNVACCDSQDARVVNFDPVLHDVFYPSKEELMSNYRVIVTTLVTAGR